ncbi:MAG: hypothetical protein ACRESX_05605 [Gammaproteobacteria bacterium]
MKYIIGIALMFILFSTKPAFADMFSAVRCETDIPKALIGQHDSNERVAVTEQKHKDLDLKDLGASEVSENLSVISWLICGHEFTLLEDDLSVVRDVLPFPSHSKDSPEFIGLCKADQMEMPNVLIAILNPKSGTNNLTASVAWKIDEKNKRFVKISTIGLACPRAGIITKDGGL